MSYINQDYEAFLETTDDPVAAALLVLASNVEKIANAMSDGGLGHEICMGIRHGLFGAHADDNVSLRPR